MPSPRNEPRSDFFSNFFPGPAFPAVRLGEALLNRGLRFLVQVLKELALLLVKLFERNPHRLVRRRVAVPFHLFLEKPLRLWAE